MSERAEERSAGRTWPRVLWRALLIVAVLVLLHYGSQWVTRALAETLGPLYARWGTAVLAGALAVYVLLMATPFVPGMEISLVLMFLFGARGVVLVYLATLLALSFSFLAGQRIAPGALTRLLGWLHLDRARTYVARLAPLNPDARLALLLRSVPQRVLPLLLRHRYLVVAVAFNTPGNALIGGGGGIALAAGMSGLFRFGWYVLTVALAISPIPVALLLRAWLMQ